jgi:hypothetical protein
LNTVSQPIFAIILVVVFFRPMALHNQDTCRSEIALLACRALVDKEMWMWVAVVATEAESVWIWEMETLDE